MEQKKFYTKWFNKKIGVDPIQKIVLKRFGNK